MMDNWILDGKQPVREPNLRAWGRWFEKADRHVAKERVAGHLVSTVFLGVDHNYSGVGQPVLFETMIFSEPQSGDEEYMERCSTWEEAEAMHQRAIGYVKLYLTQPGET